MKMIALGTVHGRKLVKDAKPNDPKSKPKYQDLVAPPGAEFDTEEFGIDADEARQLIALKAAKRKTRQVADDSDARAARTGAGPLPTEVDPLDKRSDAELLALAADRQVVIKTGASRAEIIAALKPPAP